MSRKRRPLGEDEASLWRKVAGTARALRPASATAAAGPDEAPLPEEPPPARPKARAPLASTAGPGLAPIERRLRTGLARGTVAIDSRIDLHGMTQEEAHGRLLRFLAEAQARRDMIVLVITGKGRPAEIGDERGVLRRVVPQWLASPQLRHLVIGFDGAHATHGGGGALYVRIRRGRAKRGGSPA